MAERSFHPGRPAVLAAVLVVALTLAGCGTSARGAVRQKVMQFASAVHNHDYPTICHSVLAPQLLADIAAGGLTCPKALELGLARVHGARLVVGTIRVTGSRASVETLSQAAGEPTTVATLELSHTAVGWRIVSLGNPVGS